MHNFIYYKSKLTMERNENLVHVDGQSLDHGGHGVVDDDLARAGDVSDDRSKSWTQ